jgi:hypothetical protein
MTALPVELTRPEFARQVRVGIEAFDNGTGPYLCEVQCHLARQLGYSEKETEERVHQPWLDAARRKLNGLGARLERLKPKIEEVANDPNLAALVKKSEAKPTPTYRRFPKLVVKNESVTEPEQTPRRDYIAKFIQANPHYLAAVPKEAPEEEPEPEQEAPTEEPQPTPNSLADLTLPGVAGEVQDYFLRSTMHPSRIMSIAVGLMVPTTLVCGSVIGPSGPKGCALHQNVIFLGPTRVGKQRAIDTTKECVCAADETARQLLGPNRFKSGPALVRWVSEHRVSLCIQDEFGKLLAKFSDPRSNPCEREINDRMREFAALGPGSIYNSPHGASKVDDSVAIVDARLNILGFGVPQEFYDACKATDIDNGFLNRLTVLNEPNQPRTITDLEPIEIDPRLKIRLEALFKLKPRKLDWTPAAKEIWVAEEERIWRSDERVQNLLGRTPAKIASIATTFATSRFAKLVERSDMELAQLILHESERTFKIGIEEAEKKRKLDHAAIKLEIIRRLKANFRNPETGHYEASEYEIKRSFRHNSTHKKAVPDAIQDLTDSGTLTKHVIKTLGRSKEVLRLEQE